MKMTIVPISSTKAKSSKKANQRTYEIGHLGKELLGKLE